MSYKTISDDWILVSPSMDSDERMVWGGIFWEIRRAFGSNPSLADQLIWASWEDEETFHLDQGMSLFQHVYQQLLALDYAKDGGVHTGEIKQAFERRGVPLPPEVTDGATS